MPSYPDALPVGIAFMVSIISSEVISKNTKEFTMLEGNLKLLRGGSCNARLRLTLIKYSLKLVDSSTFDPPNRDRSGSGEERAFPFITEFITCQSFLEFLWFTAIRLQ